MKFKFATLVLASAVMAAAAVTTVPAVAATSTRLNVPFSFTVGGKVLPAGTYSVERDISGSLLKLQSEDARHSYSSIAIHGASDDHRVVLRFGIDGQMHVLQTIQAGSAITPRLDKKNRKTEDVSPQIVVGQ